MNVPSKDIAFATTACIRICHDARWAVQADEGRSSNAWESSQTLEPGQIVRTETLSLLYYIPWWTVPYRSNQAAGAHWIPWGRQWMGWTNQIVAGIYILLNAWHVRLAHEDPGLSIHLSSYGVLGVCLGEGDSIRLATSWSTSQTSKTSFRLTIGRESNDNQIGMLNIVRSKIK